MGLNNRWPRIQPVLDRRRRARHHILHHIRHPAHRLRNALHNPRHHIHDPLPGVPHRVLDLRLPRPRPDLLDGGDEQRLGRLVRGLELRPLLDASELVGGVVDGVLERLVEQCAADGLKDGEDVENGADDSDEAVLESERDVRYMYRFGNANNHVQEHDNGNDNVPDP
jgi:hypothetical protein